ncbi:MAG: flagellar export protein FliJ [Methylophilaceae bacterium]|nr:MAG: flagellar export protein FliJ [Methylophilaceae bacterium]
MASASSTAINMLFDLASEEVELATKHLVSANQVLKDAQEKRAMLEDYKQDYIGHYQAKLTKGLGKESHLNYQGFLQNLQQAIDGQAEVIISAQYESDKMRENLQAAQRKKMSYEVLIKRATKKAMKLESKRDQKLMDEFAMRTKRTSTH